MARDKVMTLSLWRRGRGSVVEVGEGGRAAPFLKPEGSIVNGPFAKRIPFPNVSINGPFARNISFPNVLRWDEVARGTIH